MRIRNLVTGTLAVFWPIERLIGLAGLPDDFRRVVDTIPMIPDWVGLPALTAFIIFSWQSDWGRQKRDQVTAAYRSAMDRWRKPKSDTANSELQKALDREAEAKARADRVEAEFRTVRHNVTTVVGALLGLSGRDDKPDDDG